MEASRGSRTAEGSDSVVSPLSRSTANPRAKREALSSLIARRRPTFIWAMSNAVSVPGRAEEAQ
jgi:hypothetical protein